MTTEEKMAMQYQEGYKDGFHEAKNTYEKKIDKSQMMIDIYMEGVNMTDEYQGCWVRFKDIERIVDKYFGEQK